MAWSKESRHKRGYGKEHEAMRALLLKTVVLCEECQRKKPPVVRAGCVADHIKPLSQGGTGERTNYQLLCKECDREKLARDMGHTSKKVEIGVDGWPV